MGEKADVETVAPISLILLCLLGAQQIDEEGCEVSGGKSRRDVAIAGTLPPTSTAMGEKDDASGLGRNLEFALQPSTSGSDIGRDAGWREHQQLLSGLLVQDPFLMVAGRP